MISRSSIDINKYISFKAHNHSSNGDTRICFIKLHNHHKLNVLGSEVIGERVNGDLLFVKTHNNIPIDIYYDDLMHEINAVKTRINDIDEDSLVADMNMLDVSVDQGNTDDYYDMVDAYYGLDV